MDFKIIGYVALALIGLWMALRIIGQRAINKLIENEFDHVVHSDKHKVKGRFE